MGPEDLDFGFPDKTTIFDNSTSSSYGLIVSGYAFFSDLKRFSQKCVRGFVC